MNALLEQVLSAEPPPFALLYRPEAAGSGVVDVLVGDVAAVPTLADIPLRAPDGPARHDVVVLIPYRQITERGYANAEDDSPLLALSVREQGTLPLAEVLALVPDRPITLANRHYDLDDQQYSALVTHVLDQEIATGAGANFVLKRRFVAEVTDYSPATALAFFQRLLHNESGAYWTFIVHTGDRTFVGASPERHVSAVGGHAVMNPISGTYRYPATGPDLDGVLGFIADRKESDELYMVVDEELKMMARICPDGGRVVGPFLKEMTRLAHTEYLIEGWTVCDPRHILRETMFAPTVVGSPLESASRVIDRYEPGGRGYYSGVVALLGRDGRGGHALDSAILIRTAEIDHAGHLRIPVGATLVRHSDPGSEAEETKAKAAGLLAALDRTPTTGFARHPAVRRALADRNDRISRFWLSRGADRAPGLPGFTGRRVLVVDAEDTFTAMIACQLRSAGLSVTVSRYDQDYRVDDHDLVLMGPGPGDPRRRDDPKMAHLAEAITRLLAERRPFLAVCLSHQVLCTLLGLDLVPLTPPNQGVRREIDLFGRRVRVGFYNSFAARSAVDVLDDPDGEVKISRDPVTGEVHALSGPTFQSVQFHAESVLTEDGDALLRNLVGTLLPLSLTRSTA